MPGQNRHHRRLDHHKWPRQQLSGGGIYNDHGTLTVSNCTVNGNSATLGDGGGIYNDGTRRGPASLTINNSTISGNSATGTYGAGGSGGGIANDAVIGITTATRQRRDA